METYPAAAIPCRNGDEFPPTNSPSYVRSSRENAAHFRTARVRGLKGIAVFREKEVLRQETERANRFDRLIAVFGVYLTENTMHVILDGLLGQIQSVGDLLVGQSFSDE